MDELIFDRTEADVTYAKEHQSSAEHLKGAYNYTDLNRIEEWTDYLATELNSYSYITDPTIKTDWTEADIPTYEHMERIRSNINALKNVYCATTSVPSSLSQMTYKKANDIERVLYEINENFENMKKEFYYSNEIMAGEV